MNGIHVNWTKPYFDKQRLRGEMFKTTRELTSQTYDQPDYQIFYTILSTFYWKFKNGPIKLYTDSIGMSFLQQFFITELYDEIDINFLNGYSKSKVDSAQFWTSGKIKVLANQTKPFVFLDQDMIIRSEIPKYITNSDLTITHWEIPRGMYYFTEQDWKRELPNVPMIENYSENDLVPNTSFLVMNNMELLKKYTQWHKKLVEIDYEVPVWYWLLTDQGILGHTIRENDYKINTLTDKVFLASHNHGNSKTRYKGISDPWYYPTSDINLEKEKIEWEHVWIEKTHYGQLPKYKEEQTQRFFDEIVDLGRGDYVNHSRFKKYMDEYRRKNNKIIVG